MPWFLTKVLPFLARTISTQVVAAVSKVLLLRVAKNTKTTLDDEIVEAVLNEKVVKDDESKRVG